VAGQSGPWGNIGLPSSPTASTESQKNLAAGFTLLGLVLGFGEGDLIHGGNESCAVDDDRIIADFETYSEPPSVPPQVTPAD